MTTNKIILAVGAVIVAAVILTSAMQTQPTKSFSQIVTVGPIWNGTTWSCTSDADFKVDGALRGLGGATLAISISSLGTQSLYSLDSGKMQSFSVGSPAGHVMSITKNGTVTGWITLQTLSDAKASCIPS